MREFHQRSQGLSTYTGNTECSYYPSEIHLILCWNWDIPLFTDYQHALANRGSVDFEDLIRLAYKILLNNPDYLKRLRYRWPYILGR